MEEQEEFEEEIAVPFIPKQTDLSIGEDKLALQIKIVKQAITESQNRAKNIFLNRSLSRKAIWFGRLGMLMGAVASIEYYMLGEEFGTKITNSDILINLIGISSYITSCSMNILVNQEEFEDFASIPFSKKDLWASRVRLFAISGMLIHSGISAFVVTGMLLRSLANTHLAWRILLSIPSFISNLAIFYYTDDELLGKFYYFIRNYLHDDSKTALIRKQLMNTLEELEKKIVTADDREWLDFLSEFNFSSTLPGDFFINNKEILGSYAKVLEKKTKCQHFSTKMAVFLGLFVGVLSVSAYYNVGVRGVQIFCPEENDCNPSVRNTLEIILGVNTFSSYLILSDLNIDAFDYYFRKIQGQMKNYLLRECSSLAKVFAIGILIVICGFSTIPNVSITVDYLLDWNLPFLLYGMLITSAFIGPFSTNSKWFLSLANDFYVYLSTLNLMSKLRQCLVKEQPETQPLGEHVESYKPIISGKRVFLELVEKSKRKAFSLNKNELEILEDDSGESNKDYPSQLTL